MAVLDNYEEHPLQASQERAAAPLLRLPHLFLVEVVVLGRYDLDHDHYPAASQAKAVTLLPRPRLHFLAGIASTYISLKKVNKIDRSKLILNPLRAHPVSQKN